MITIWSPRLALLERWNSCAIRSSDATGIHVGTHAGPCRSPPFRPPHPASPADSAKVERHGRMKQVSTAMALHL
jgi:hypothetical protein